PALASVPPDSWRAATERLVPSVTVPLAMTAVSGPVGTWPQLHRAASVQAPDEPFHVQVSAAAGRAASSVTETRSSRPVGDRARMAGRKGAAPMVEEPAPVAHTGGPVFGRFRPAARRRPWPR